MLEGKAMRKTNWFPADKKPKREGLYEVQTPHTSCRCCWEMAHFQGGKWWLFGLFAGMLHVRQEQRVTHWRGLAEKPSNARIEPGRCE